jgi:hypothetical protein
VAFVELDAQMAYKQAVAHALTGNESYALNALDIVDAWARHNKHWGLQDENGPLEAAWGVAAMAKALEMLKASTPTHNATRPQGGAGDTPPASAAGLLLQRRWLDTMRAFAHWCKAVVHPQMAFYVDVITQAALQAGRSTVYGNWHASIAEAWMAVGVLADDLQLYGAGVCVGGCEVV